MLRSLLFETFCAYSIGSIQVNRERHNVELILGAARRKPRRTVLSTAIFAALCSACLSAAAQQSVGTGTSTVFATGNFILPEGIGAAPSSFGGGYLVSDPAAETIYRIGPNGGAATVFSTPNFYTYAGTQLSTYYNGTSIAGQYLEVGSSGYTGMGDLISSNGTATTLFTASNSSYSGVVTAQSNYGSIKSGQEVLIDQLGGANGAGEIDVLNKNGTLSRFAAFPEASTLSPGASVSRAFGIGFAPSGFGKYSGDLFASDDASGSLYVVNAQGQSSLFAQVTLPTSAQSPGLRQFAWAPAGFGQYSGDLFVSVAAQIDGGGSAGEIEVFNANGQEVGLYEQGSGTNPLDPRGLLFTSIKGQTELLAVNADPEIDVITPASFKATAAPEIDANTASAALTLLFGALAVLAGHRRRHACAPQTA